MASPSFQTAVHFNLIVLKINAFLFSFPISINVKKHHFAPSNSSALGSILWHLGFALLTFKMFYIITTFVAMLKWPGLYNELHFPLHFVFMTGYLNAVPCCHAFFNIHRDSFSLVWNTLLTDLPKVKIDSPMQLQLALGLPVMATTGVAAAIAMFAFDHSWLQQLQYIVSKLWEQGYFEWADWNFFSFKTISAIVQILDAYTLLMLPALACYIATSHMFALEVRHAVVSQWVREAESATPQANCNKLRQLQLIIRQFNDCHSSTVFLDKIICLSTGTVGLSAILLANFVHPVTTGVTAYISIMCVTQFPTVYEKAYVIYDQVEQLKRMTLRQSSGTRNQRLVHKTLRSVQNEGILVGGFRRFERDAFLVYGGFIISQVVSILISWG